jgi:hypothetical protein
MDEYESQTELALRYGVTSHVIGRWLAELGLRVIGADPTQKAHDLGLVLQRPSDRGDGKHPCWVWHVVKTTKLLNDAGHKEIFYPEPHNDNPLIGPFGCRLSGTDSWEIHNSDGKTFCWVVGEKPARFLVKVLNALYKFDKLPRSA